METSPNNRLAERTVAGHSYARGSCASPGGLDWFRMTAVSLAAMCLAGCGVSDLSRLDSSVQASWSVLRGIDRANVDLAERLIKGRHAVLRANRNRGRKLRQALDRMSRFDALPRIDLTDPGQLDAYISARTDLVSKLAQLTKDVGRRSTPARAWRSRDLHRLLRLALLRSREAVRDYNASAAQYNRSLGQDQGRFSKAVLYPGIREVALLETRTTRAEVK